MARHLRTLVLLGVIAVLAMQAVDGSAPVIRQASAPTAADPAAQISAARTLRLPSSSRCVRAGRLRLRFVPPAYSGLVNVRVTSDGAELLSLDGVFVAARATVRLGAGRSTVRVRGETIHGTPLRASKTYRRCSSVDRAPAPPTANQPPIISEGGGSD